MFCESGSYRTSSVRFVLGSLVEILPHCLPIKLHIKSFNIIVIPGPDTREHLESCT